MWRYSPSSENSAIEGGERARLGEREPKNTRPQDNVLPACPFRFHAQGDMPSTYTVPLCCS
jgi:hypothetical protein